MSNSSIYRQFKRRIGQISRRVQGGPSLTPKKLRAEVIEVLADLQRASAEDPNAAIELAIGLLETLPRIFMKMEDERGLLPQALEQVPVLLTTILNADRQSQASQLDAFEIFERIFCLWVGDDSGYLYSLDEALLAATTTSVEEEILISICRDHLRQLPLVFPAVNNNKLDIERSIQQSDRHRVERLLGEIYHRAGNSEFSVVVARGHYRVTGDAVDYVRFAARAGLRQEAMDLARRVLRNTVAPRRNLVRAIYEELVDEKDSERRDLDSMRIELLRNPSIAAYEAFITSHDPSNTAEFEEIRARILSQIEQEPGCAELAFRLYIREGMICEADGLVVGREVDPYLLAACAQELMENYPLETSGWLVIAAHRVASKGRAAQYREAVAWLAIVAEVTDILGKPEMFDRALAGFRDHHSRKRSLMHMLEEAF